MRIRKTDAAGDMVFGRGARDFWHNEPDGVALLCSYRLAMNQGDWWLDLSAGTPWQTQVIGNRTEASRDPIIKSRIQGTQGVTAILSYSSTLDRGPRAFSVRAEVTTSYSTGPISLNLPVGVRA